VLAIEHLSGSTTPALRALRERVLPWYAEHKRDLPWRRTRDPYALVAAEMMLQQTGVERIAPKWLAFVERFPTWEALASAPLADVIREWRGLGYNRRAVSLHRIAQAVVGQFGGRLPEERKSLLGLPGVGPYTANAILSFVHGQDVPAIDVNLQRVIGRVVFGRADAGIADVEAAARAALPAGQSSDWNQALMDFASIQCTLRRPACLLCPLRDACAAAGAGAVAVEPPARPARLAAEGSGPYDADRPRKRAKPATPYLASTRYLRGRIVDAARHLPAEDALALGEVEAIVAASGAPAGTDVAALLAGLVRDGLLAQAGEGYRLP
jgi:A/G-specific adenine glycosylase